MTARFLICSIELTWLFRMGLVCSGQRGKKVRAIIRGAKFPQDLQDAIINAYKKMEAEYGKDVDVAVLPLGCHDDAVLIGVFCP